MPAVEDVRTALYWTGERVIPNGLRIRQAGYWGLDYRLMGTARLLLLGWDEGNCPIGILLDRLTECPEECAAPAEVVAAAVEWLRE